MLKPLKRPELIRRLRERGSKHQFMAKGALKLRIPNPHQGDITAALLREILRQAGIDPKDW